MANSTKISEYSTTAANNTSIDSIDIDENCAASGINNALRSVLKHQADAFTQGTPIALDQTNNRVGIGTTSPAKSLSINTSSNTDGIDIGGGGTVYTSITSAGTDTTIQATNAFAINTNGANERLRIDSSGRISINETGTHNDANEFLLIKNTDGAANLSIVADNAQHSTLNLGDEDDFNVGRIRYQHSDNSMRLHTADVERMRIDSSGRVYFDTTTVPSATNSGGVVIEPDSYDRAVIHCAHTDSSQRDLLRFFGNSSTSQAGKITCNQTSTVYLTSSDYRLKENVIGMTGAIARVKQLAPKRFNFIADADTTVDGFLAHEAQTVVPEAVSGTHNEVDDDGNAVMQGIDQAKLVPLLTGALQEAITKIETLETEMTALKARVTALEA